MIFISGSLGARYLLSLSANTAEKDEKEQGGLMKTKLEEYFKDQESSVAKKTPKPYTRSKTTNLPSQLSVEEEEQKANTPVITDTPKGNWCFNYFSTNWFEYSEQVLYLIPLVYC